MAACFLVVTIALNAQNYKYWVKLSDKQNNTYSISNPEAFLSEKAIQRRSNQGIAIDSTDLPVSQYYIDEIEKLGAEVLVTSKWLNGVTIAVNSTGIATDVSALPFVEEVAMSWKSTNVKSSKDKFANETYQRADELPYGYSSLQIAMHNGQLVHEAGFTGEGMVIAVLDNGFQNAPQLSSFQTLFSENRVLGTRDFVNPGGDVYLNNSGYSHGTAVLSCLTSELADTCYGTAFDASFWLFRTEDTFSEQPVEMDYWVAGAELADSVGADLINSSLGYYDFDEGYEDYTYADMDGKTTRVSVGANMAVSKGMVVCCSVGNEANNSYGRLIAPSDAVDVLAIGSVNNDKTYTSFSSRGYSSDGRVKPDVAAMGRNAVAQTANGGVYYVNGTSFSSPILCGMAAALWQARPELTALEIIDVIRRSGESYDDPNDSIGYGIADIYEALGIQLNVTEVANTQHDRMSYPNPFSSVLYLQNLPADVECASVYQLNGQLVFETSLHLESKQINIPENLQNGLYILKIQCAGKAYSELILKHD